MDSLRPAATVLRRTLLTGRRTAVTLVALLLVWIVIGFVWAVLLGALLVAALVLGDKPLPTAPSPTPAAAARTEPPATAPPTAPATPLAAPATVDLAPSDDSGPTMEKAYAKLGLSQLPPFEGLGEVRTYDGPRKLRLMPDNPIEQRFDGRTYSMHFANQAVRWVTGRDRKGNPTFTTSTTAKVPVDDITGIDWREPDPRVPGTMGLGQLTVRFQVGKGRHRTDSRSRGCHIRVDQVEQFRGLRDYLSAATGLPVTAAETAVDLEARRLLKRATAPFPAMGPDGRSVMMPPEPL